MAVLNTSQTTVTKVDNLGDTIVEVGPYRGLVGTMWLIAMEEGEQGGRAGGADGNAQLGPKKVEKRGQGVEGLWRGWRVGMWGLVGMWGAAAIGGIGGSGGEF